MSCLVILVVSIDIYLFGLRKEKSQDGTIGQIENIYISELETEVVATRHVRAMRRVVLLINIIPR